MIRALFVLSLIVAAVSAFVAPVNHAAGELHEAHIFSCPFFQSDQSFKSSVVPLR